ncbi:hypothetical protein RA19_04990 [Leisingera sp. ANG-M1]|uniref:ABC transporter permease n=1 Tax=Leisingera sp. ANG-M1 TaxID=1577895 RepID=UPI00057DB01C|nr:ABC transporter permease subunit [Leisingera sp. ANG-M1]KIC11979.1 hypothetical protein RA19_04990 [Leisingera sp. ANG-M1]
MTELFSLLAFGDEGWGDELLRGFWVTMALALVTAPCALAMSFVIAWGKHAKSKWVRRLANGYTTVFRSLPEILTLIIIYYQLQSLLNLGAGLFVEDANISLNAFAAGVVALTLVFSALGSEVVRTAYQAVGQGQSEAAAAMGLHRGQAFFLVILPQMWRHAIPAFGNLWLILLKDTSLISIIAVNDMMRYANMAIATTREPFFFYSVLALVYVVLAFISGQIQTVLEARANRNLVGGR